MQVRNHSYGDNDINTPGLFIQFQFSEIPPDLNEQLRIRDVLCDQVEHWFEDFGDFIAEDLMVEVLWVPASGSGTVDGVPINY